MLENTANIFTIDCNYVKPELACAYLIREGDRVAFVENNTNQAVPLLLAKLKALGLSGDAVDYIIITHVHLDHAGGTAELLKHCPNATVLAHPRAAPHLIKPERLVQSAAAVYGEESFQQLYGRIEPVAEERVKIMQDGESVWIAERELKFIHTRGHANHHFVIFDSKSRGVFTGDSFGIAYPALQKGNQPFLFPSTTPTDFHFEEALASIDKINDLQPQTAFLTHFGEWQDITGGSQQLRNSLGLMKEIMDEAIHSQLDDERLMGICLQGVNDFFTTEIDKRELQVSQQDWQVLKMDIRINAMGLAHTAIRTRKKQNL